MTSAVPRLGRIIATGATIRWPLEEHPCNTRTCRTFIAAIVAAAVTNVNAAGHFHPARWPVFIKSALIPSSSRTGYRRLGYSAAYCPEVKLNDTDRIRAIEKAFADANVLIAEVGA